MRGPDLRVLLPAVVLWATLVAAVHVSTGALFAVAAVTALAAALVACLSRSVGPAAAAALAAVAAGCAVTAIRDDAVRSGPLPAYARRDVVAELTVVLAGDPVRVDGAEAATGRRYVLVVAPAQAVQLDRDGRRWRLRQPVLLLATDVRWLGLLPGQRVRTAGTLRPPDRGERLAAVVSVRGPPASLGAPPWPQRAAGGLRAGLRDAASVLGPGERALLPGLVDGDVSALGSRTRAEFRATGLTHLVAVSGANVAIVVGAVLWLLRRLGCGPRLTAAAAAIALAGFVVLARPSPSVLRAAAMGAIALLGLAAGRPRAALPSLAGATVLLLLVEPALATAPGFQLSAAATAGLIVLARPLQRLLARRLPSWLAAAIAVPTAAQLACSPLIALIGGGVSPVAIPANLLAAPAVAPATLLGVLAAAAAPVVPPLARGCAWLAGWPCAWLLGVAHVGAGLPYATIGWPDGSGGALLVVAATGFAVLVARRAILRR